MSVIVDYAALYEGATPGLAEGADAPHTDPMQQAGDRAINAWASVERMAEEISSELEDVTVPHGIPVTDLPKSDPLVTATSAALAVNGRRRS